MRGNFAWLGDRLRKLGWRRLALLGEAFVAMVVARVMLAVVPVRWILRGQRGSGGDAVGGVRSEVGWAVAAVARRSPVGLVCFPQCLAAGWMLRRRGVGSVLHYGVRREDGRLLTHTWLESGGVQVVGEGDGFSTLGVFGESGGM